MTKRVLLHVGAPKTGTSFVQDILFSNRDALRERGILYPADRHDAHFLAALDLMELPWGGLEREAVGAWDRLAAEVREWPDTAIISHEILGTASRVQVARAIESLGGSDTEIHIVFSARDLVRQIPAEWQENVKHRRTKTYGRFLENLRDPERSAEVAQWFWGVQEIPDVLDRWGEAVPRERVHLVTVPPPGSSPTLLWERFAGVFGIDPTEFTPSEQVEHLARRTRVGDDPPPQHAAQRLAAQPPLPGVRARDGGAPEPLATPGLTAALPARGRLPLGERPRPLLGQRARAARVRRGRHRSTTWSRETPLPFVDPDHCDEEQVADAALDALAIMTKETAKLRDVEIELHGVIEDLMGQLDRFHATRTYKAKERLVAMSRTNAAGPRRACRSTAGCGAGTRGPRSGRSATSRTRRCPPRPAHRRPAPDGRP